MTEIKRKTLPIELHELEQIKLDTVQEDGKRFYVDDNGERYPSVTTVTSLLTRDQIKLWRERVGEEMPIALEAPLFSRELKMAGRVDCVGLFENRLSIIDFKTSSKFKTEEMAKPWFVQMTAYAIMVEELTNEPIEEITAIVAMEDGNFQLFSADPGDYVEQLYSLRQQYRNLYGV